MRQSRVVLDVTADTAQLARKLDAFSRHSGALAAELRAIDEESAAAATVVEEPTGSMASSGSETP